MNKKPSSPQDYNASKKGVYYSDQLGVYYSCLHKVTNWYKKAVFEKLFGNLISKLSDTFEQVLCGKKALNGTVSCITYLLTLDRKMRRRYKTAALYWIYLVGPCAL